MKVWINIPVKDSEVAWISESGRRLVLFNKSGQTGRLMKDINLGYIRNGKTHMIFLNKPKVRPSSKTVGIFVWPGGYTAYGKERFSGKTKGAKGIDGMFGIYDVGTRIETAEGGEYMLSEANGWVDVTSGFWE